MEDIIIDGVKVNKRRVNEHEFIKELTLILKEHFNNVDISKYWNFKEWYVLIEPYLVNLRKKYDFSENPPYTNTTIILHKSCLEAKKYNEDHLFIHKGYNNFLKELDKLFKVNNSYTTPKGYVYYFDRIPTKAVENLKEDIIKEYGLSNDVKQQDYILQHILKELKTRFN